MNLVSSSEEDSEESEEKGKHIRNLTLYKIDIDSINYNTVVCIIEEL